MPILNPAGTVPLSLPPSGAAGGDLTGNYPNPTLAAAGGGAAGPTGSATVTPVVTVDAKGRVTALTSATIAPTNAAGGDLTGNYPNPTLAAAGGGAAGPIGSSTVVPVVTVDAKGRVTALTSANIASGPAILSRSARASNTILAAADLGTWVDATAAYTQTLTAPATLGAGWWCYLKNDTADGTTVLGVTSATGNIDGIVGTTGLTMYSGDTRLLTTDGNNFYTAIVHGGYAKFTPTGGSFIVPTGIESATVVCVGSGGQGGGGFSGSGAANLSGGAGGGGGAVSQSIIRASDLGSAGSTITVTVGAGGSSQGAAGSPGTAGQDGALTSFGSLLKAGGGGGGGNGASASSSSGGAGGSNIASAAGASASGPNGNPGIGGQACSGGSSSSGGSAEWGGASGAGRTASGIAGNPGGTSIYGGPAGGSGGGCSTTTGLGGGAGGATQAYTTGGGPAGGTGGATTTKGGDGSFTGPYCGTAGAGGGSGSTGVTGKAGGAGSIGAGGGGGGSSANTTGGGGGAGGAGECRVWYQ